MHLDKRNVGPPVILAPMAGITDLPFRTLVQRFGTRQVVSEMIASRDMVSGRRGTRARAELGLGRAGTAVQLAGRDPHWMAEAARMVEAEGAEAIDINMGCPAKKVTGGQSGSALMRDLMLAVSLVTAVVGAVSLPVTLKCRLGWDAGSVNAAELARMAESEGIARIAVHARTRCQFYSGRADWSLVADVADAVSIPVIVNGDISDAASAARAVALSGARGVMIGRAARGRPWLLAEIAAGLGLASAPARPFGAGLSEMVAGHYQDILAFYGSDLGLRVARKHLGWYMDDAATPAQIRRAVLTAATPGAVLRLLPAALAAAPIGAAA